METTKAKGGVMATTREKLIDWLAELPDNIEIGIEDEHLIVIIDTKAHFFDVGALSDEALDSNMEAFLARRRAAMDRLREIHEESAGEDTDEGAMVVRWKVIYAALLIFSPPMRMRLSVLKTERRQNCSLQTFEIVRR